MLKGVVPGGVPREIKHGRVKGTAIRVAAAAVVGVAVVLVLVLVLVVLVLVVAVGLVVVVKGIFSPRGACC